MPGPVIVITGTDTGVGKTLVTACLARALRLRAYDVRVLKPFASGITPDADDETAFRDDDALILRAAAGMDDKPLENIRLASFRAPLAPLSAARLDDLEVDFETIAESTREAMNHNGPVLIEGVGGVAVPVAEGLLFSDFLTAIDSPPTLLVARSALGTVNHTFLSAEHLRSKNVPLLGVVFSRSNGGALSLAEDYGPMLASEVANLRSLGLIEHYPNYAAAQTLTGAMCSLPWEDATIQGLADYITSGALKADIDAGL